MVEMIESEFIEFKKIKQNPRTSVYAIIDKKLGNKLGVIKWHGAWRGYCFFPNLNTLFDTKCMYTIIEFIEELMNERKKLLK